MHQTRLCIEALRKYLARNNRTLPAALEADYRQVAYTALLRHLGSSYDGIRLARAADTEARKALAKRLGIELSLARPDQLDRLFLPPGQCTETDLERLFGLADTTRDPLTTAPEPEFRLWQLAHLRALWQRQDSEAQSAGETSVPVIDPDLVAKSDLRDPVPGNPAHDVWQSRQQVVTMEVNNLKKAREAASSAPGGTPLSGFNKIVSDTLGPVDALVSLAAEHQQGKNIEPKLREKKLRLPAFLYLLRVRDLAIAGTVLDTEWNEVYAILVQVRKLRDLYPLWGLEEQQKGLTLGPDYFKLPAAGAPRVDLPLWRATQQARQTWLDTLEARINQERATLQTLQAAIDATEEATLPILRDALIGAVTSSGQDALAVANRLTQELCIDCKSSGNQKTTRMGQAIYTLQDLLLAVRTARLATTAAVVGTNPAATWVLTTNNGYTEAKFDAEWLWMGTYATWRAAMFHFGYPENTLLPSLRPAQEQTPAFQALTKNLRARLRLTPAQARAEAQTYLDKLRVDHADLPAAVKAQTFTVTDQLSDAQLIQRRDTMAGLFTASSAQQRKYLEETFYFVPLALALQLQKSGEYVTALDWLQTIYAYNLPSGQRKIYHGLVAEEALGTTFQRTPDWLLGELNPHGVAKTRAHAYTRFTIMSLVRCLQEFADTEFTRDTDESLPTARSLYVTALALLDPPELQPPAGGAGSPPSPFPPNPLLHALRQQITVNLFKLRNGLNIVGLERSETLQPTPYRYPVLIERAKQLVTIAQQIEAAFLAALEKRDAEAYSLLKAQQDLQLSFAGVQLQHLRVQEAQDGIALAGLQQQRAQIEVDHFADLLGGEGFLGFRGISFLEIAGSLVGAAAAVAGFFAAGPAGSALAIAGAATVIGGAPIVGQLTSFQRRQEEWEFQLSVAQQDVLIVEQQLTLAQDHALIVGQELAIAAIQASHAHATLDFLNTKFTGLDLFEWMSGILEQVYAYFLQQATAMAKLAERQLKFERQKRALSFIETDYWEVPAEEGAVIGTGGDAPDRRGLTGSARLQRDISKLDQHAFETDKRKLQLTKTISLAQLDPFAFQRFRETGVLIVATPMDLFDRDFPGHYLRLVRRVRTTVLALIPPHQGIRATLSTVRASRVVIDDNGFRTVVIRRTPESVALTSPLNTTGLFELENIQPDLLLPFEGTGVDTMREFYMPKAANQFDYTTIADVLLTVEYTALDSPVYRQQVIRTLNPRVSADRPFSFRHQFTDQWYEFHNPNQSSTPMAVRMQTVRQDFPQNIDELKVEDLLLYFVPANSQPVEVKGVQLRFKTQSASTFVGGAEDSIDGVISTQQDNASAWQPILGKPPVGQWELVLPNTEEVKNRFKNEEIEDILLAVTYSGRTPAWPV